MFYEIFYREKNFNGRDDKSIIIFHLYNSIKIPKKKEKKTLSLL